MLHEAHQSVVEDFDFICLVHWVVISFKLSALGADNCPLSEGLFTATVIRDEFHHAYLNMPNGLACGA